MKKLAFILLVFLSFTAGFSQNVLQRPNPPRLVNDAASVLSPDQVAALEQKLVALDDSTSNQIAVVLINSLGDNDIESYATKLFREWGIGNKKTNNGILILAAIQDRKLRIEVGYGLEGAIPDVTTASIIRNEIAPHFKDGDYYSGINAAIDALTKAAVGEYKVKTERRTVSKDKGGNSILGFIVILVVIFIVIGAGRGGRGGGGRGRGGGWGSLAEGMIIGSLLSGGRGGGGGGWSGGGGGGGFGGFGGGSSGGGGASGSW